MHHCLIVYHTHITAAVSKLNMLNIVKTSSAKKLTNIYIWQNGHVRGHISMKQARSQDYISGGGAVQHWFMPKCLTSEVSWYRTFSSAFLFYVVLYVGLCVQTVWASMYCRDPAFIGGRRLFKTRRLLEHGHKNPQRLLRGRRLFETRRLLEVLR